jgi:riboflavin kinase/FMN adenylyltransferase
MRVLGTADKLDSGVRAAVTIGAYDGVHRGHQWLLRRLRKLSRPEAPVIVVTFDPHPLAVIRPVAAPRILTSTTRKLAILEGLGFVDACLIVPFDLSRREQRAADFVDEILVGLLHAETVMVGSDFRFGRDREGDIALLRELGGSRGYETHSAPLLPVSNTESAEPCSSTGVRALIRRGRVEQAARLLGRPHQVDGVVAGTSRPRGGRGVPTVVVRVDQAAALPVEGSYLGALVFGDGRHHVAGLSIRQGIVAGRNALVDAHLAGDFNSTIGNDVVLEFSAPLWASGRTEVASQVSTRADEIGKASAAGGWGAAG